MKIGILTTGDTVVTTINLNWLPQYLYFIAATVLSAIKVTIAGDGVLMDIDAAGIAALSGVRRFGAVANSYLIPLCDGFVPNKVVEIQITNSAAQTPYVYGFSLQKGLAYLVTRRQTILASSGVTFEDFVHLAFNTVAATDEVTIKFVDGHVQKFNDVEFKAWYTLLSNETDSFCVDNIAGMIDSVNIIPTANAVAYISKWHPVGDIK